MGPTGLHFAHMPKYGIRFVMFCSVYNDKYGRKHVKCFPNMLRYHYFQYSWKQWVLVYLKRDNAIKAYLYEYDACRNEWVAHIEADIK